MPESKTTSGERGDSGMSHPQDSGGLPRLLIADDDPVVHSVLSTQLRGAFTVVAVAANATDAITLAAEHQPDVALIDVEMPNGGAREAVPGIALLSPRTCMVILSSDESRRVVLELLAAGATAYMRKGVSGKEINRTLTDALRNRADRLTEV
jgi:DNA-binding NarL/FixJ family response regulator